MEHLVLEQYANNFKEKWMKCFLRMVIIVTAVLLVGTNNIHSQSSAWQVTNTRFIPQQFGLFYEVNKDGRYILEYDYWLFVSDTLASSSELLTKTRGDATRWWNDTIL